ncbi:hypothetical protein JG688_00008236, partial [Phytophthora aleatoria]
MPPAAPVPEASEACAAVFLPPSIAGLIRTSFPLSLGGAQLVSSLYDAYSPFCLLKMVTKTSTSSSAPAADTPAGVSSASATSTATASSTVVATTPASTPSDCLKAPPSGAASPSSVDASPDASASAPRYGRVPPAVLQSVKASLTYRKSCLKRSKSSVLAPPTFSEEEKPAAKIVKVKLNKKKEDSKPVQKNRRRCWECKVKVGLTA